MYIFFSSSSFRQLASVIQHEHKAFPRHFHRIVRYLNNKNEKNRFDR